MDIWKIDSSNVKNQQKYSYKVVEKYKKSLDTNFGLQKDTIKEIFMNAYAKGRTFYPSDLANDFNLDMEQVMKAMDELYNERIIVDAKNVSI